MQLVEITYDSAVPVEGYGPGFFRIKGQVIAGPMLATGARAIAWGGLADSTAITALAGDVDVVFLGMGAEIAHAPAAFRAQIEAAGMGLEVMSSPAACRTYNVLLSEGRRVALAALPV